MFYACQCRKCGKIFDIKEATDIGVGSMKSPCCDWSFYVVDNKTTAWLDDKYLDVNNDDRYYSYI